MITYDVDDTPVVFGGSATATTGTPPELLLEELRKVAPGDHARLSEAADLALSLLLSSFYITLDDARFIQLVTAFETLAEQGPRSSEVASVVDDLIATVQTSTLQLAEIQSLTSQLRQMKWQSVNRAARDLVAPLEGRQYGSLTPFGIFQKVYGLRNRMVHGSTDRPTLAEIRAEVPYLLELLTDLLRHSITHSQASK